LPAGAYLIATVTTPSGAASIAGSTIVQSYGFAQLSGGTVYARTLALLPTTAVEGDRAVALGTGVRYERAGSLWRPEGVVLAVADFAALAALPTGGRVVGDLAHVAEGAVYMSWTGTVWRQTTTATFASTGARDTAYAKAGAVYRVAGVRALDTSTGVESQRIASEWVLDYELYVTPLTALAGYTVQTTQTARRAGRVVTLQFQVTKSTAWTAVQSFAVLNIVSLRPVELVFGSGVDTSSTAPRGFRIAPDGTLSIWLGQSGVAGATPQSGSITWVTAE